MTDKKTPKPRAKSKAAQIRRLCEQGKMTPKQIAEKVGVPPSYVYVLRSKMKAEGGGLPAVSTRSPMPVPGGIQEVATETQAARAPAMQQPIMVVRPEEAAPYRHIHNPATVPARVVLDQPTFFERVKERIRAWLA